jgi:ferritin
MTRMNLAQLVAYFESRTMPSTAQFFQSQANEPVTVDGLIEESFVMKHLFVYVDKADNDFFWRQVKSSVTSYLMPEKC